MELEKLREFVESYKGELEEKSILIVRLRDENQILMQDKQTVLDEIDYLKTQIHAERYVKSSILKEMDEIAKETKALHK